MEKSKKSKQYSDLEMTILSCLVIKPELMEKTKLEEKHFTNHKRLWVFMKSFYKKYHNFDFSLMCSVSGNEEEFMDYMLEVFDYEFCAINFDSYEKRLIEMYNKTIQEDWATKMIYTLANDLYVGNIDIEEFIKKENEILEKANIESR